MPDPTTPSAPPLAADPYADREKILELVNRKMTDWGKGREVMAAADYRSVLLYRGHHWSRYDRNVRWWRPMVLPKNYPTPVVNLFASTMDAFIAVLARIEPLLKFPPTTDEAEDQATSDVAERVIEVVEDEVGIRQIRQALAQHVGLMGGAWIETGVDPDLSNGTRFLQKEECLTCGYQQPVSESGACEECGSKLLMPAQDENGPVGEDMPVGKLYVDVVPKSEMFFDPSVVDWKKQRACCRQKAVPIDEAKERWPEFKDQITPDTTAHPGELYNQSIATLGPNLSDADPYGLKGLGITSPQPGTKTTERWYWQLPDSTYPEGLFAIVVSKTLVVKAGPLPYSYLGDQGQRNPFLPYTFFPQKMVPGSAWPKTVADDLAPIQIALNKTLSGIQAALARMGWPKWLIPIGSNVQAPNGDPGAVIFYNALGPSNAKPEVIPGQNINVAALQLIEFYQKSLEEVAATFDVIKGNRPEGVTAGIALQILQERGQSRFAPMFILWETAWAEWARQALEIFRQYATEDRILRIKGKDGRWETQKFLGADLQGRINVRPEAGSALPRSSLVDRAEVEQLIALGVINPADPHTKYWILKQYGKTEVLPGLEADTKNALMENEVFAGLGQNALTQQVPDDELAAMQGLPYSEVAARFSSLGTSIPQVRPVSDDHATHSRVHKEWLKSESARALPMAVQALAEMHVAFHDQLLAQQMAAVQSMKPNVQPGGAGFNQQPSNRPSPANSSSSMTRMGGDHDEMGSQMAMGTA